MLDLGKWLWDGAQSPSRLGSCGSRVHPHFGGKETICGEPGLRSHPEGWSGAGQKVRALGGRGRQEAAPGWQEGGLRVAQRADGCGGTEEGDEVQMPPSGNPKLQHLPQALTHTRFSINI